MYDRRRIIWGLALCGKGSATGTANVQSCDFVLLETCPLFDSEIENQWLLLRFGVQGKRGVKLCKVRVVIGCSYSKWSRVPRILRDPLICLSHFLIFPDFQIWPHSLHLSCSAPRHLPFLPCSFINLHSLLFLPTLVILF